VVFAVDYRRGATRFRIKDTGAGIPPQDLEKIFQPFQRGLEAAGRGSEGLGLGLTISRMLTELMGGTLGVESAVGVGSTFQVKVNLPEVRTPRTMPRPGGRVTGYRGRRRTILVVDDQCEHRQLLASLLDPLGFRVSEASHGGECLAQVGTLAPDAILMDLIMPDMDGLEATRRLRADHSSRQLAIIAVSANAFDEDREKSVAAGCNDFLPKPIRFDDLLSTLKGQLALEWVYEDAGAPLAEPAPEGHSMPFPPVEHLHGLMEHVRIGYVRGLLDRLDEVERLDPGYAAFVRLVRQLAKEFRLNEITELLDTNLENDRARA
jgi:CheY-like chemotaxis protein